LALGEVVVLDLPFAPVLCAFTVLAVFAVLAFWVFVVVVAVVESPAALPLANAGMVNENTTNDANIKLSSFFMFFLLLVKFAYASL
jgi:hypothetical protein